MAPAIPQATTPQGSSVPAPIRPPVSSISAVAGMNRPTSTSDSPRVSRNVMGPAHTWLASMKRPILSIY
ncbi:hypothetical protein D3C87_1422380 [compost metagenome]